MFRLSRLLDLAGTVAWHLKQSGRQPLRYSTLRVTELEERLAPALLGQQLFPADYPWNQNISNAPLASNSGAIISHIGSTIGVHPDWGEDSAANGSSPLYGIPYNVVHGNSVSKVNVIIDNYPGESDVVAVPMPANPVIEGDWQNGPNTNGGGYDTNQRGDSHLIVWDVDNNIAYELYGASRPTDTKLFPNTSGVELAHTDGQWHAAQESVWNMSADSFRSLADTSADAAGLSILAGLARPDEGLPTSQGGQGAINHALRFTLPPGDVAPQYIYPASHVVSTSTGSTKLPFGARLRLANTPAVNAKIALMDPQAQIIAHTMQQYGLVLADIGSTMFVTGASGSVDANNTLGPTWDMDDVLGLEDLKVGDFEVVDLTPQVTGLSASSGPAGSSVTVIGQNFSGAAGHLSVFFGGVAASSVTFVDDSHLSVIVPNGAGTVHVTVQSGVKATDPNNANDNVKNPIFGYGTSTTSAADQFTYSGAPISGTNSTDSLAAPTVVSGNTDALTIAVKDANGSPVSGLTSSAFGFTLSGGTSAGTFGTVTETATKGTYTTTFTGTTPGTASTLTVAVAGAALSAKPVVTVTPSSQQLNQPPTISPIGSQVVNDGSTLSFTVAAASPVGGTLSFSLASGAPVGAGIDAHTGLFSWTPSEWNGQTPGAYSITVLATEKNAPQLTGSITFTVTVGPSSTNQGSGLPVRTAVAQGVSQSAEYFTNIIVAAYNKYLGRGPDAVGLSYWLNLMLYQGLTDERLEAGFIGSQEYIQDHGGTGQGWITGLYTDLLGRPPGDWEVQYWVGNLSGGMSPADIAYGFAASAERESQRVTADYQRYLGRGAHPDEIQYWVGVFLGGANNEQVIAGFVSSQEYFQNHGNNVVDWLFADYRATLGRNPDTTGYQYWIGQLQ